MSNVAVCVRFRPPSSGEAAHGSGVVATQSSDRTSFIFKDENYGEATYSFDRVFDEECTQTDVYDVVALPIVKDAMNAINGTILAYGQTGAGKTYTMEGPNIQTGSSEMKGILPRVAESIFEIIQTLDATVEFVIKLSMVEIYKEKIRDLFDTSKDNLQVKEDKVHGIFVAGAIETYVQNEQEMLMLLEAGIMNRACGTTQMNARSSRSHCVCLLTIEQINSEDQRHHDGERHAYKTFMRWFGCNLWFRAFSSKTGKLYLVDLAGSEKLEKTGAEGLFLDEAKTINKSLSALGNVINSLTNDKAGHIPYRDSKLTRILQESLGGNSKTTLLCCCSPSSLNSAETLSTLRFGTRAKLIKNVLKMNSHPARHDLERLLEKSRQECDQLRTQFLILNARLALPTEGTVRLDETHTLQNRNVPNCDRLMQKLPQNLSKKGSPTSADLLSSDEDLYIEDGVIPSSRYLDYQHPRNRREVHYEESKSKETRQEIDFSSNYEIDDVQMNSRSVNDAVVKTVILLQKAVEDLSRKCEELLQENGELKTEMIALARLLSQSQTATCAQPHYVLRQEKYLQNPGDVCPVRGGQHGVSWLGSALIDEAYSYSADLRRANVEESTNLKIPVWSSLLKMITRNIVRPRWSPLSL